ncbi:MAG: hypothetical protein H7Y33_19090 [Cytophagales bacterium]|nr:hypothetical protein [Rhizobacter sp.]
MSNALFLPRELFAPATPAVPVEPVARPPLHGAHFASVEAVAADLLKGIPALPPASTDRRRKPRSASARGVDLYLA